MQTALRIICNAKNTTRWILTRAFLSTKQMVINGTTAKICNFGHCSVRWLWGCIVQINCLCGAANSQIIWGLQPGKCKSLAATCRKWRRRWLQPRPRQMEETNKQSGTLWHFNTVLCFSSICQQQQIIWSARQNLRESRNSRRRRQTEGPLETPESCETSCHRVCDWPHPLFRPLSYSLPLKNRKKREQARDSEFGWPMPTTPHRSSTLWALLLSSSTRWAPMPTTPLKLFSLLF